MGSLFLFHSGTKRMVFTAESQMACETIKYTAAELLKPKLGFGGISWDITLNNWLQYLCFFRPPTHRRHTHTCTMWSTSTHIQHSRPLPSQPSLAKCVVTETTAVSRMKKLLWGCQPVCRPATGDSLRCLMAFKMHTPTRAYFHTQAVQHKNLSLERKGKTLFTLNSNLA